MSQLTPVLDPITTAIMDSISTLYGTNSTTSFSTSRASQAGGVQHFWRT